MKQNWDWCRVAEWIETILVRQRVALDYQLELTVDTGGLI